MVKKLNNRAIFNKTLFDGNEKRIKARGEKRGRRETGEEKREEGGGQRTAQTEA